MPQKDTVIQSIGMAEFFHDSVVVAGEGFSFTRATEYNVVRILFDDDGKIAKVETMASQPWKVLNKNTIYLLRGANLNTIARHFGVTKEKLRECNKIKNENHIEAFTKLRLNCSE